MSIYMLIFFVGLALISAAAILDADQKTTRSRVFAACLTFGVGGSFYGLVMSVVALFA